ncbi:enoyl-CoA hydratase [Bacterioplanes sanyensis]|uniref:enoyl-CoA hydratase/isomerase family protein n=1 Tax=Bacterioplanes sanyensis TaxID=1249553 RepID=UPI00167799C1|nr:enoyl-CoA hydratase/isomerase family protein [Bacterioplanes sanyensis]GGY45304.1 enoyl-CoA hydratase [Bacterioplanes sanyensis]
MSSTQAVLSEELSCGKSYRIGVLTLNKAKAMNAVDLAMVGMIGEALERWQKDDRIVAVVMRGAGDKAFCAGGDIRQLYDSMQAKGKQRYRYADDFFSGEYGKNYRVHQFTKPLIAWGQGFVMGGGLGLFIGANHRIGCRSLKLAWPEVRIGLFPDVAASYYLARLPYPMGHWMGLSASHINAADARQLKLTQYTLGDDDWQPMLDALQQLPWQQNRAMNHQQVRTLLTGMTDESGVESHWQAVRQDLHELFGNSLESLGHQPMARLDERLRHYHSEHEWLNQGLKNYRDGCPATACLIMEQLRRGARMSLKEVVQWELVLAYQAVRHPDFAEGIRAMVVDKDNAPKWQHRSAAEVPASWLAQLTASPWNEDEHPLAGL